MGVGGAAGSRRSGPRPGDERDCDLESGGRAGGRGGDEAAAVGPLGACRGPGRGPGGGPGRGPGQGWGVVRVAARGAVRRRGCCGRPCSAGARSGSAGRPGGEQVSAAAP